ncbi:MAG: glucokinase [Deltaproteobacteria bacterium]|nr:glucokinase [Deltaproteobacteria bacterium]
MPGQKNEIFTIAGDIGGTKTNIGLFAQGKSRPIVKWMEQYPSQQADSLESMLECFIRKHKVSVRAGCFGVAGVVNNGLATITNLPWNVSVENLKHRFGWPRVKVINDLTATALSIPFLNASELFPLNEIRVRRGKNIGLLAPGTGLGESILVFEDGRYIPVASEGGHVDFAPTSEKEIELWQYLHKRFSHVSKERVLSGKGIFNIYSWLRDSGAYKEPSWLKKKITETDPARAITSAALNNNQPLARRALDVFVSILGSAAGNLALSGTTSGGIFLGGGIPPKILPKLKEGAFMESFTRKGQFKRFNEKIPVRVILNDRAALLGAACHAFSLLD